VDVTGSIEFSNHKPGAAALDDRDARKNEPRLLVHTRRTTHLGVFSALSQAALLDRSLDLFGVENRR
jgi:hypothetical protein